MKKNIKIFNLQLEGVEISLADAHYAVYECHAKLREMQREFHLNGNNTCSDV